MRVMGALVRSGAPGHSSGGTRYKTSRLARQMRIPGALLVLVTLTSCESTSPFGVLTEELRIGLIETENPRSNPVVIPNSVTTSTPFLVTVLTHGNTCVRLGETEVETDSDLTRITPYDFFVTEAVGIVCKDILLTFSHDVPLQINHAGDHRVVVVGRHHEHDTETFDLEYIISVH